MCIVFHTSHACDPTHITIHAILVTCIDRSNIPPPRSAIECPRVEHKVRYVHWACPACMARGTLDWLARLEQSQKELLEKALEEARKVLEGAEIEECGYLARRMEDMELDEPQRLPSAGDTTVGQNAGQKEGNEIAMADKEENNRRGNQMTLAFRPHLG